MVAHGGKPDQVKAPPPKVAKEFVAADKGKKRFSPHKEAAKVKALRKPSREPEPEDAGGLSGTGVGGM
jgi:hypothetical protein